MFKKNQIHTCQYENEIVIAIKYIHGNDLIKLKITVKLSQITTFSINEQNTF